MVTKKTISNYLDSFQYAATSNFGKTRVAFKRRAIPTPSHNCIQYHQYPFLESSKPNSNIYERNLEIQVRPGPKTHISSHLIEATIAIHSDVSITLCWKSCSISTKNQSNCLHWKLIKIDSEFQKHKNATWYPCVYSSTFTPKMD